MALPFAKIKEHTAPWDDITNLQLSPECNYRDKVLHHRNKYVLATSRDMTIRIFTVEQVEDFKAIQLSGHRSTVVNAFWIASPEYKDLKVFRMKHFLEGKLISEVDLFCVCRWQSLYMEFRS
jgi:hypothetical protein